MHLRPPRRADISTITQLVIDGFEKDELTEYMSPHRHAFPQDYYQATLQRTRHAINAPGSHNVVCVADADDADRLPGVAPGTILGMAFWQRAVAGKEHTGRPSAIVDDQTARQNDARGSSQNTDLLSICERGFEWTTAKYNEFAFPNRSACDREAADRFREGFRIDHLTDRLPGHWYLALLSVETRYRRKGIASVLLEWGIQKAQAEGVPCIVNSSIEGQALYEKYGFRVVSWLALPVDLDWLGGAILIWDPWRIWVEDLPGGEGSYRGRRMTARMKATPAT